MEQLLIAFVQRVGWAQELLKENCGERKALWCARRRIPLPRGMTRRLRHGSRACSSMGRSHFSFDGERKVCKRKPAAQRLRRRPTSLCTAVKPCAALGLGYALHGFQPFLALVGLRPPLAVGFGLREPNGWMPRINSGHPIPALRPEQSDHVPWADCPQGLSSASVRFPHPPGKSPLLPIFERGSSQCRAQHCWRANSRYRARSCSLLSSFKKGKAFSLRCLLPLCSAAARVGAERQ